MNIKVVNIEKIKNKYVLEGIKEYNKRLNRYCKIEYKEVKTIKKLKDNTYIINITKKGKQLTSIELADKLNKLGIKGKSNIVILLENNDIDADLNLSISDMDIDKELLVLILFEQIYRSFCINTGNPYHK